MGQIFLFQEIIKFVILFASVLILFFVCFFLIMKKSIIIVTPEKDL